MARHKVPVTKFLIVAGILAIIAAVAYTGFATRTSIVPDVSAKNFSLKITPTSNGPVFMSAKSPAKKSIPTGLNSPTINVARGDKVTVHVISEIHGGKYDFAIPDLNVRSKELGFFEADTITFVADQKGEFIYTSTGHPEMKGLFVVQ